MDAELTDHLGYERGDPAGRGSGNSRNGTTAKRVGSEVGDLEIDTPRDRLGTFDPRLVPKGVRRLDGLDAMIVSLFAGGMTVRDIRHHLAATLGTELSHETISNVTEAVAEEVKTWQARALEPFYPVVYLDALVVKVRDGAHVTNRSAHIAVGVDPEGVKHVLGIWVQAAEGARFWSSVCAQLANRGVRDILIVCCDGLTGLPEAIEAQWPKTVVQTCTVHLIRALDAVRLLRRPQGVRGRAADHLHRTRRRRRGRRAGGVRPLRARGQVPGLDRDLARRVGAVRAVPGLRARGAPGDLHDELD